METLQAAITQYTTQMPPPDGWFYYALTISLFLVVIGIVYGVFKWFVNRLDEGEERKEKYFEQITKAITELQKIVAVHESEIENIKDKVFPVRYPKKK